jgi:hypothetical protein
MKPSSTTASIARRKFSLKKLACWLVGLCLLATTLTNVQIRFNSFEINLIIAKHNISCHLDAGLGSKVQPWLLWCR